MLIEIPAVSGEAKVGKKVNKAAETFDKYFSKGEESRSGSTSELATWMDSVLLKEVILVLLLSICLDTSRIKSPAAFNSLSSTYRFSFLLS